MTADQDADGGNNEEPAEQARYSVDARGAIGVAVGDNVTQIVYTYDPRTWTDRAAPPPLIVAGVIHSPYRGLRAFDERDAPFFCGRDSATAALLERMSRRLAQPSLMVVSGVSGAGKSSLVRAGVLPRIRGTGLADAPRSAAWPCLVFTPGRQPLRQLAVQVAPLAGGDAASILQHLAEDPTRFALHAAQAALAEPAVSADDQARADQPRRMFLVVDQFEQVFTQCSDEEQRRAFITALHAAATVGHGGEQVPAALVVLVVRADFEARCADYPQLTDAVRDRYLVTSMTRRQLREAITKPARTAGSAVDADLVETLLDDVRTSVAGAPSGDARWTVSAAGVLPLLSHALDKAWRGRQARAVLTEHDYELAGGIEGAVAESAGAVYEDLSPAQRAVARQVFIRLTATSGEGVDTADRVPLAELTQGATAKEAADVRVVLESFAAERLLTLASDTVEISHEVLLSSWPLLRDSWLAETHTDRIVRTRLRNAAADWGRNGHDPSYLYAGSLLVTATSTAEHIANEPARQPPLSSDEREFLRASGQARRRRARLRQSVMAFLMVLVVTLAAATIVAFRASQEAAQQRDVAIAGQLISQSLAIGATDPTAARLESLAAWGIDPTAQAHYAMLTAEALPVRSILTVPGEEVTKVGFSADGRVLATDDSTSGTAQLWDVATGRQIGRLGGLGNLNLKKNLRSTNLKQGIGPVWDVALSPVGTTLATAEIAGRVRLWNLATGRRTGQLAAAAAAAPVTSVTFSPDGKTLAIADEGSVRLWDVATGHQIGQIASQTYGVNPVVFSPDGKTLAVVGIDKVRVWDIANGRLIDQIKSLDSPDQPVAFSSDGKTIAVVSFQPGSRTSVRLWDVATGNQVGQLPTGSGDTVDAVAFSPDGATAATASGDGTVVLWDAATGQRIGQPLTGPAGSVSSMAFSPDGKTLATGSLNGTTKLWDLAAGHQIGQPFTGNARAVNSVAFSPTGKTVATAAAGGTARLWDAATGRQIAVLPTGPGVLFQPIAFSPGGRTLATIGANGAVRLWDVATGHQTGHIATPSGVVTSIAFSPNGKTVATAGIDSTLWLWNVATGRLIRQFSKRLDTLSGVAFSPDSKTIAVAGSQSVHLWDVASGRQVGQLNVSPSLAGSLAFSPDGKTLAITADDGSAQLWDVAGRRQIGQPLTSYTGLINAVAFSPDGRTVATAGNDGTARLWDVATGRQIGQPLSSAHEPLYPVNGVAFSPDGRTLVTASDDGTARLWNVGYLVNVLPQLCSQVNESLTPATWAQYVPPGPAYRKVCR